MPTQHNHSSKTAKLFFGVSQLAGFGVFIQPVSTGWDRITAQSRSYRSFGVHIYTFSSKEAIKKLPTRA